MDEGWTGASTHLLTHLYRGPLTGTPRAGSLAHLPPEPPLPAVTNLDVTAMCALVSEVSYYHDAPEGGELQQVLDAWSTKNVHWKVSGCEQAGTFGGA